MQARHLHSPGVSRDRLFEGERTGPSTNALAAAVMVVALLSGCSSAGTAEVGPDGDTAAVSRIEVIAGGEGAAAYAFNLPERVPPGPTRILLQNNGDEPHHAQLFKLHRDATADELAAAFATGDPAAPLEHGSLEGGTALVSPGQASSADAIVELTQGRYVVLCVVEGSDGVSTTAPAQRKSATRSTKAPGRRRPSSAACRPSPREPPSDSSSTSNPARTSCCARSRHPTEPRTTPRA
jgi:hypothetical protein